MQASPNFSETLGKVGQDVATDFSKLLREYYLYR
jgi:hypothetical protein